MAEQQSKWDAGLYDTKHSFVYKMAEGLLELLRPQAGERIMDLGCGTAHLTGRIAESGCRVTGIDRSPEMIRQARQAFPGISFEVADATAIPLAGPFEAVFSNATLHWIKEPEKVLREISRLLGPGGRFVAEFGGHGNIAELVAAGERAWARLALPPPMPNPWFYPGIAEYAALVENHGLEVTYALLFDRPTELEDGEDGLRNWLRMFGGAIFETLSEPQQQAFVAETVREARPALFREGRWVLDYRRLRVVARKL